MIGGKKSGEKVLIGIEWKYTERYGTESKYIPARSDIYDPLLRQEENPINVKIPEALYYEPFYQLMRQTLLLWKMVENNEYDCGAFLHLHVIPRENKALRNNVTSPLLYGSRMSDAWKNSLRNPNNYLVTTPSHLLSPISKLSETKSYFTYLRKRYWG